MRAERGENPLQKKAEEGQNHSVVSQGRGDFSKTVEGAIGPGMKL